MQDKIIFDTDSYKYAHAPQYPKGTTLVSSYGESRGGEFSELVFFGLQYHLKEYLSGVVVTQEDIDEADQFVTDHMGPVFNRAGWQYIVDTYGGRLPVEIRALPEGTVTSPRIPLFTIENTDRNCFWLTNFLETLLSRVWNPITVASSSRAQKKILRRWATISSDDPFIDFKLHDFGARGVSSFETAAISGAAHLVNFQGTDTVAAIRLLQKYYGASMPGFSIPAAEHSTITSWTRNGEVDAYRNMLEQFPAGLVAVVSDSYDVFNAVRNLWGNELRDAVLNRDGTLVIRPDSGDDIGEILVTLANLLTDSFGYTVNSKGFKVLHPKVRLIQGDGINRHSLDGILKEFILDGGFALDNIAFGSGGGLLQQVNRDTIKFAIKCSYAEVNGQGVDVYKDPVTDSGKRSKAGRFSVIQDEVDGSLTCVKYDPFLGERDMLVPVFRNGDLLKEWSLDEIRERAAL